MSRYRAWRPGQSYLLPGEVSVASTRLHWIVLWREAAIFLGVLVVAVLLRIPPDGGIGTVIGLVILGVLGYFSFHLLEWYNTYFEVTDKRVLLRSGLLTTRIDMMPVTKVTDMSYERSAPGRILGYGTFVMESAGQDQALSRVSYLPDSDRLYRETLTVIFGEPAPEQVARFEEEQQQYEAARHGSAQANSQGSAQGDSQTDSQGTAQGNSQADSQGSAQGNSQGSGRSRNSESADRRSEGEPSFPPPLSTPIYGRRDSTED